MSDMDTDSKIIFVVGNSRSGTTLMGSILGSGSEIFTFEELHFFDHVLPSVSSSGKLSRSEAMALAAQLCSIQASDWLTPQDPKLFAQEAQAIALSADDEPIAPARLFENFLNFKSQQHHKVIPCEQTPQNVFHIKELLELYPNCRIINMVRDPRDVLLSQKYKWRIRFLGASNIPLFETFRAWSNYHSTIISLLWNLAIQAAACFKDHPRVKTVRFEDLVLDPESVTKNVCEFAGVTFSPQMLNVSQGEGGVSSHKKISSSARGIDPSVVSKWEKGGLLNSEVHICQSITHKNMVEHGYLSAPITRLNKCLSVSLFILLPFKLSLALLLNLNRVGNLRETVKKRFSARRHA